MTGAQRREARVALAMLPAGVLLFVASAVALVAVGAWGGAAVATGHGSAPLLLWCLAAAGVALWNLRAGIAMMSAFDWRPLPLALALSALIVAVRPDWPA